MVYDITDPNCDCNQTPTLTDNGYPIINNILAPIYSTTSAYMDVSGITDSISTLKGISNFCGYYTFDIDYVYITFDDAGLVTSITVENDFWPEETTVCNSNCGD